MTSQHPNGFSCTFGMQYTDKKFWQIGKNHLRKKESGKKQLNEFT